MDNKKDVDDPAALASKIVVSEARLQNLRNLKAPDVVLRKEIEILAKYNGRLAKHSDANRYLAEARIVSDDRTQSRRYILEMTLLGRLVNQIDVLRMEASHSVDVEDTSWPPEGQDMLEVLTDSISARDPYKTAFALGQVLDSVVNELEKDHGAVLNLGPKYDLGKVN